MQSHVASDGVEEPVEVEVLDGVEVEHTLWGPVRASAENPLAEGIESAGSRRTRHRRQTTERRTWTRLSVADPLRQPSPALPTSVARTASGFSE
ncbi:hypothetical protein [Streptomyces hyaluromycini]|uniref:hypothetical protein n=1 Tax=Streptomyces hyaluromycini TaxID=1377993 RepID=UPI0011AE629D|nr:hypothetical protein [Streptomyces hyaluromycini]